MSKNTAAKNKPMTQVQLLKELGLKRHQAVKLYGSKRLTRSLQLAYMKKQKLETQREIQIESGVEPIDPVITITDQILETLVQNNAGETITDEAIDQLADIMTNLIQTEESQPQQHQDDEDIPIVFLVVEDEDAGEKHTENNNNKQSTPSMLRDNLDMIIDLAVVAFEQEVDILEAKITNKIEETANYLIDNIEKFTDNATDKLTSSLVNATQKLFKLFC